MDRKNPGGDGEIPIPTQGFKQHNEEGIPGNTPDEAL
jgi:hypothetical protein